MIKWTPVEAPDLAFYGLCTLDRDSCTTCGDVAIPVKVIAIQPNEAVVEDRLGQREVVATDFIPECNLDDVLLVHMGVAIAKVGQP